MDRKHVIAARNHSYEGMLAAQYMQDSAKNKREAFIADSLYYAFWSSYNILCELEKMETRKEMEARNGEP